LLTATLNEIMKSRTTSSRTNVEGETNNLSAQKSNYNAELVLNVQKYINI